MSTILIVDDNPVNREFLVTVLGYRGHQLFEAADGREALRLARQERPDLIIADILMPTMDGYELVRQLRSDPLLAATPVVFYTAYYHQREAQALAKACGVSHILTKPSEPEDVFRVVDEVLGLSLAEPAALIAEEEFEQQHLQLLTDTLSAKVNELQASNERLRALIELGLRLGSEKNLNTLLETFCRTAREIIGARFAAVQSLDKNNLQQSLRFVSGVEPPGGIAAIIEQFRQVLDAVVVEKRPYRLQNLQQHEHGFEAILVVPVVSLSRAYGWCLLADKVGVHQFNDDDEQLASILASQMGRIYENGSLYLDLQQRKEELLLEVEARKRRQEELRQQKELLQTIFDHVPVMLAFFDQQGRIQLVNKHWEQTLEWTLDEARNVDLISECYPDPIYRQYVIDYIRNPPPGWADFQTRTKSGKVLQTSWANVLLQDGTSVGIGLDVTEQRQAQQRLAERTRLSKLGFDIGQAVTSDDDDLRSILQHCCELLVSGLDAALARIWELNDEQGILELQASAGIYTHTDGAHSRIPPGALKIGRIAATQQPMFTNDLAHDPMISDPDWAKRENLVSFAGFPLLVHNRVVGVVAFFSCYMISELTMTTMRSIANRIALGIDRKRTQEKLAAAQSRLQNLLTANPTVIYSLKVDGERISPEWVSENITRIWGYEVNEALANDWWSSNVHPEDLQEVVRQQRHILLKNGLLSHTYRFRHKDGKYRWLRDVQRLLRNAEGEPMEIVGSWTDVHEHRILEEQFRHAQKMEAVGRLAGGVAHDFNNLLTVINGYSDLLLATWPDGLAGRSQMELIRDAGDRAAALTRQLLAFSRRQILEPVVLDVNTLLMGLEKMLRRLIGEDIEVLIFPGHNLGSIKADPSQIEQVLINLVVNARDAMPCGGRLTIETRNVYLDEDYARMHTEATPGPKVLISVTDTGVGMDRETQARIFEPFFTTKEPGKGTGLGLSTAYSIIKQSEGHMEVYSEPGMGTHFKVYLPRVQDAAMATEPVTELVENLAGNETILVVEDDPGVRALARLTLEAYGYTMLEATHGNEALRLIEQHQGPLDLVLTDVVMPEMGGTQLAEALRASYPGINIIFMSGYADRTVFPEGTEKHGKAFLQKPITPIQLLRKIREVLNAISKHGD